MTWNQLTAIEISIQRLHKQMNLLQNDQLIHLDGRPHDKIQTGIAPIDKLVLPLLDDIAHLRLPGKDVGGDVPEDAAFFGFRVGGEEFREADFPLARHEDYEVPAAGGGDFGFEFVGVVQVGHGGRGVLLGVVRRGLATVEKSVEATLIT